MKMYKLKSSLVWMLLIVGMGSAQVKVDTTFKGTSAIAAHLSRLKAPLTNSRPADLELRLDIGFDLDSDALIPAAKAQLDTLAYVLKMVQFANTSIELAGHTCDIGSEPYNLELSRRRVKNAVDYLASVDHITRERLSQRAYGEELPLIPGANSEEERQVNRRVVVYLPENRESLEKMLREMPVAEGFRWGVFRYDRSGKATLISYDGSTVLHSNDEYRVFFRPARTKYVYLYQQDGQGHVQWIFPRKEIGLENPLQPGEYYLPSRTRVFVLDNTIGTETLHLVVTDSPALDLEKILTLRDSKVLTDAVGQTVVLRGIKEVRDSAVPIANNDNVRSQTVEVMSPEERARKQKGENRIELSQAGGQEVMTVMAQHREFYMKLRFGHE